MVLINGSGQLPELDDLVADREADVGPDFELQLRLVPSETVIYPESDAG